MKKNIKLFLSILIGIIVFLIISIFTIPFLFEDKIAKEVIKIANEELEAEISIDKFRLTLYRHFPDFTLELNNLEIKNKVFFQDTILASINRFEVIIGLSDILKNNLKVKTIGIVSPTFNIVVDSLGNPNYDISKKENKKLPKVQNDDDKLDKEKYSEFSDEKNTDFKIALDEFFIEKATIKYFDRKSNTNLIITNLNHKTRGRFTLTKFILETKTNIEDIFFSKSGITLLKETNFYANINANVDTEKFRYEISENEVGINNIKLNLEGQVYMPENEPMDINFKFNTSQVEFKDLLSMIPGEFKKNIKDLKTSGKFEISGKVNGKYEDSIIPALDISFLVKDGYVQYPKLPKSIQDINLKIDINKKESKDLDALIIDVSRFDLNFGGNPVKLLANIKTPIADPDIKIDFSANIDLDKIEDVIPISKNDQLTGKINSEVYLNGKLSYIEKKQYDNFFARGNIDLMDVLYSSQNLPFEKVKINKLKFKFSPQSLELANVDILVGSSDLNMKGNVSNYLGYIFKNQILSGKVNIVSNNLSLDELTKKNEYKDENKKNQKIISNTPGTDEKKSENDSNIEKKMKVILIPDKINLNTNISLQKVNYGDIKMTKVKGDLGMNSKTAYLKKISLNTLEGDVVLNGNYNTQDEKSPKVDMDINVNKLDIASTIKTFPSIKEAAPQVGDAKGKFSSLFSMKSYLKEDMKPNFKTLYSKGNIKTQNIELTTSGALREMGKALKIKELQNPKMEDLNISYVIERGVLKISPIVLKSGNIEGTMEGESYIEDQTVNMVGKFEVPRKDLGDINKGLEEVLSLAKKNNIKVSVSDKLNIKVKIHGKAISPEYTLLYGPKDATSINEYISYEIETLKKNIEENIKSEAKDKLKKEAENLYKKNEDKVKNAIKKLF